MNAISRREFLKETAMGAAAAGAIAAGGFDLHANPLGLPIGSQTYPHRALVKQDFPGLLKQMADLGIQSIELCSPFSYQEFAGLSKGAEVRKIIADHGLKCISCHFGMKELRQTQEASIAWAKEVGVTQMLTATLGAGNHPTMDVVKKAADEYNKIAEVAARAGIQQGLHNEGFEVSSVDGKRTYDILFELLDPKLVKFQFQMSTIMNGFDAAEYFKKYPGRFISMHLQDWNAETKTLVAVGKGSIDWKRVFTAAKTGGVKNYFIEQNWEMTKEGVAFLKTLKV
ncbi:MAG: sugar phosphate isomerase/epimerase [Chloracidobacterium sp.]|nr:sugar phosphate isomerase/epimerase [Chloracidobacterium sp.]